MKIHKESFPVGFWLTLYTSQEQNLQVVVSGTEHMIVVFSEAILSINMGII